MERDGQSDNHDNRGKNDRYDNNRDSRDSRRHNGHRGGQGKRYPDRWDRYYPIGKEMTGTRFVAFKCPLDESFFARDTHPDEFFDIHTLVRYARDAQRQLGMVIDLTNTTRYYNKDDWYDYDVEYRKLFCPGHEVNGRDDIVEQFNRYVDDFLERNKDNDLLIGVHCTHGLNRTGYLICRYLIDRAGWKADDAIRVFEECRGHPIERNHYKVTLREIENKRAGGSGEVKEERKAVKKRLDDSPTKAADVSPSSSSSIPPAETDLPPPPSFDEPVDNGAEPKSPPVNQSSAEAEPASKRLRSSSEEPPAAQSVPLPPVF